GHPVYLREIWPSPAEVSQAISASITSELFRRKYGEVYRGPESWQKLAVPDGDRFQWDQSSTYIRKPTFFDGITRDPHPLRDIVGARVLALLGDSITTDHIS